MPNRFVRAFVVAISRSPLPAAMIMLIVALEAGCGPSRPALLPAEGLVTLDGKPLADAAVAFQPKAGGRPASARTDASGRFKVGTYTPRDGALPGEHTHSWWLALFFRDAGRDGRTATAVNGPSRLRRVGHRISQNACDLL